MVPQRGMEVYPENIFIKKGSAKQSLENAFFKTRL
jgi:hypothetical protein